jgi:hypothetical protein
MGGVAVEGDGFDECVITASNRSWLDHQAQRAVSNPAGIASSWREASVGRSPAATERVIGNILNAIML